MYSLESIEFRITLAVSTNDDKMRLTEKAVTSIRKNNTVIGKLIIAFNRGQNTIENWLKANDSPLTTPKALSIISEETGLTSEQILEEVQDTTVVA